MMKIYETCIMPIPVKDSKGKAVGSIAIGDLIAPYDDSFGAEVARTAFQLIGLPYGEKAGQGNRPNLKIDCQGLVRWVLSEIDTDWGDYGIGKGARYQIDDFDPKWNIDEGHELNSDDLQVGNTLFWRGDETGEIKHTAIYIGKFNEVEYMIEAAGGSVRIVPLRMHTNDPKGEDSTLCQINQMTPGELDENVTEYLQMHIG
jgi:cell wall-associated NlpC family hydrolase